MFLAWTASDDFRSMSCNSTIGIERKSATPFLRWSATLVPKLSSPRSRSAISFVRTVIGIERIVTVHLARVCCSGSRQLFQSWRAGPIPATRSVMKRRLSKWLVSIAFLSTACGQTLSGGSPGGVSSTTPDPGTTPLPSTIRRDDAIALVTHNDDVGRVDRTDAKLMTFADYLRIAGPVRSHGGDPQATPDSGS